MVTRLLKNTLENRRGLSLIEVLMSMVILGIIVLAFINLFVYSTLSNVRSEEVLDATYLAQNIMEERYGESKIGGDLPESKEYELEDYWVEELMESEGSLVNIRLLIYDEKNGKLEAQIEAYFIWNGE